MSNQKFTPEHITELQENEIFVFGSNLNGNHAGGAARMAVEKFGAIEGQADGLQGQSYAIPTLDKNMKKIPIEDIKKSLELLADFSMWNTEKTFYVTKIGLGIAGFTVEELKPVFDDIYFPDNIILPVEFKRRIRGIKAFNKGLKCRDFQYEENKEYKDERKPSACNYGFHFCENPRDTLGYYPNLSQNEYAEVEALGDIDAGNDKVSTNHIKIGVKIELSGFIKSTIAFTLKRMWWGKTVDKMIATTGYEAHSATTGYYAHSATTGNKAHSATTGYYAHSATTGLNCISAGLGFKNKAKAALNSWIALSDWRQDEDYNWYLHSVISKKVDGKKIKADTFYTIESGKLIEVEE